MKRKPKCYAMWQGARWCDGCSSKSTKCPYRNKYRDLRHTKKPKKGVKGGYKSEI